MALGRLKLSSQLTLLVVSTSLLAIALLSALWLIEARGVVEREIETRSTTMLQAAAQLLGAPLAYGDTSSAAGVIETLVSDNALDQVYLFDTDGVLLARRSAAGQEQQADLASESVFALEALSARRPVVRSHAGTQLDIAVPITVGEQPMGVVAGEASFAHALTALEAVAPRMLGFALLVALAAALLAVAFGRSIAAPLRALAAAAAAIGEGRLEAPPAIGRGGEVGALAAAFTRMVEDLRAARAEVAEQQRTLERRVAERTAELERALSDLRASSTEREQLVTAVRELASPVLPVIDGILVMPLIGVIDSQRAADLTGALLSGVQTHRARVVILDVTGVPIVDTQVARALLEAADAVRLLGARTVLVGLRPELAQTIVGLGVDLTALVTRADLQSGVDYALALRRR